MKYGQFSDDKREYIINRPDTPRAWVNYLFNNTYHAIISQTGGGFSYCRDPKFNRIHRYERIYTDRPGRYLYLHDLETNKTWSANWQPMKKPFQKFEVRHGLGYTIIISQYHDIETKMTFFVPQNGSFEICIIEIINHSKELRKLKAFPFIDFIAGDAQSEIDYPNILSLYNRADYHKDLNAIIAYKLPHPARPIESYAYFATSAVTQGYDCSKEMFVGRYNSLENPIVIQKGICTNSSVCGEDMVGVFELPITLDPDTATKSVLLSGFIDNEKLPELPQLNGGQEDFLDKLPTSYGKIEIEKVLTTYLNIENAEAEFDNVKSHWKKTTTTMMIETPDENFNVMTNIWGKYQLFGITHWRGTSAYHNAEGGVGYRDTAQDAEGILALDSKLAKTKIVNLLRFQYSNGHAVSGFSEKEGSWESQAQATVTGKSDVAVWLVYSVHAYLAETGDFNFLNEEYPFINEGKGTVFDHCLRAVFHLTNHVGEHGFPLICKADWNDAYDQLGYRGKGETIWLAMATVRALKQMRELAEYLKEKSWIEKIDFEIEKMKNNIMKHGWDGNWFIAAINDVGFKVGSAANIEGKIPLNSQTWAILSEIVDYEDGLKLAELIDKELDTAYGPALFTPVYTNYHPGIGRVTSFAPGTKENASVFSHAAAFKVVADCVLKRGNEAYNTFCKILPQNSEKSDPEKYKVEPYVFAEYVVGPGHPTRFGEGAFTWNTGTTPWMFMAATEWICGIRRTLRGLLIDPCIPEHWDKLKITRPFRDSVYKITIHNPAHVQSGVVELKVDGEVIEGQLILPHQDGKEHQVDVMMG